MNGRERPPPAWPTSGWPPWTDRGTPSRGQAPAFHRYRFSVADADPGSGAFLTPRSGSGMNNPDHISESLETIFWVKILHFFDADPGSGMEKIRIRDPE